MTIALAATKREETGKRSKRLVEAGQVPGIVYGPKQEATPITLSAREFEKVLRDAGESSVIELTGLGDSMQVLIHEVDLDPVKSTPRHVDLYAIEKGAKVEVAVELVFVGESPAVKAGASLVKVMHELEIEAAPADLPHEIQVDISALAQIGDQIHVADLKLPAGVEAREEGEQVVALVQEVKEEEEAAGPVDMSAIEVEQKGKEEEESSEGESKE